MFTINLLLRSLADGSSQVLPLEQVLPVDTNEQVKAKILHAYPPLLNDGEFFLAFNGNYLEDTVNEQTGQILTVSDYGIEANSMVQVVRLEEIMQQQEQEAAAGNPEAEAMLQHYNNNSAPRTPNAAADLSALAAEHLLNGATPLGDTRRSRKSADEQAQEEKDLKTYKNKARKNKWRIRGELLPNDGGKSKVTVHDRQYDKLECYVHALLYDYQDPATWTAIASSLQHPLSPQKTVCVPVQGSTDREQMFTPKECYTISLRLDPMNAQTWVMMGACLSSDLKETVTLLDREMTRADCFARAGELDPLYPRAWYNLALCLLDNASTMEGIYVGSNEETVESCLLRVLQCDPRHAGAWVSLGLLLSFAYDNPENDVVSMGEESYDRKACLAQALKCDPKHARAWYNLGVCLPPPHFFASLQSIQDPRERELKEEMRFVQIGEDSFSRQECFEKSVRYKPRASHHWCALATELPIEQKTVPFPDCPHLAKWDCFAKALEFDNKSAQAWCGLGQTLLSAREKGMNLPTKYRSFGIELPSVSSSSNSGNSNNNSASSSSSSGFTASLPSPDVLTPKHCFETALSYKFKMGRAWMSLVYVLGKDYVAFQEEERNRQETAVNPSTTSSMYGHKHHSRFKHPPQAKIRGQEYSLKECATYNVEYNYSDARAWGNLAATLTKFDETVYITDFNNENNNSNSDTNNNNNNESSASPEKQEYRKLEILQQAINLDGGSKTPLCGKWWMDLALCLSEPGSSEDFDPRPDRILMKGTSLTKYDCIEKALELDSTIPRAWFELASFWSKSIRGEAVATQRAFHDFSLVDLIIRAVTLDSKNAQGWMLLAGAIFSLEDTNGNGEYDDDEDTVTMEVDGTVHSYRSTMQKALECDRHVPRAWRMLAKTFRNEEKTILISGKVYTKIQCIVKALEENDHIDGSGTGGLPPSEEQEETRKEKLRLKRHAGNFSRFEEPFSEEELFSLWYDLAMCLRSGLQDEIKKKEKDGSILHGSADIKEIIRIAEAKYGMPKTPLAETANDDGGSSLFPIFSSSSNNALASLNNSRQSHDLICKILWATTSGETETFSADRAFVKALNIFNTSAKAWHGLASSIDNETFVTVDGGKWNRQSCLEKTLTYDEKIRDAWVELGQILPDDARTGCAYVSMQRISRQACYEKALELDLEKYEVYHDSPAPVVSEADKLETAKLWCLFGSSLKAGVWVTLNGEAMDQQRCFFKALSYDINSESAWTGLGFIALEATDGKIKVPIEPSKTIEIEDDDEDENEAEDEKIPAVSFPNNTNANDVAPPVPAAIVKRKKKKEPKFLEFTAAECFERSIDAKLLREGRDPDDEDAFNNSGEKNKDSTDKLDNDDDTAEKTGSHADEDDHNVGNGDGDDDDDTLSNPRFEHTIPDVTVTSA